jgi:hypothetical protein
MSTRIEPPPPAEIEGMEVVGYSDVGGRPPFKLALARFGERWLLYCGHLWHRGWSVVDVTDPTDPRPLTFVDGPADTWTAQVNVADGILLAGLSRIPPKWGGREGAAHEEAALILDLADPVTPRPRAQIRLGGTGSHRSFWAGGRYAHLAANAAGFEHYIHVIVDMADPSRPVEVGRWWMPGQGPGETPAPGEDGLSLHGPAYVHGDRAYLAYGGAGMIILDISSPESPRLVSRFDVSPPFRGGLFGAGVHTVRPLPGRGLAVVHGEAGEERCREPLNFAGLVDISDERAPWLRSLFPVPRPPAGLPYTSYCDKGGRFGPHNSHLPQGSPDLDDREDVVYLTWFNAGLRVYDITDAREPVEIGRFVPADPTTRYGPLPATALVTQSEDVLVDRRGFVYLSDKNQGLYVLRATALPSPAPAA